MARAGRIAIAVCCAWCAYPFDEPEGFRDRFLEHIKSDLDALPDFVCTQSIERFTRGSAERAWEKVDSLRLQVAMAGNQELYGLPGERKFRNKPLAEFAGHGSIGTGQLGLLARHVFLDRAVQFTYKGETEQDGRSAHEYSYDVPQAKSSYRLSFGSAEAVVAFQGRFWIDAKTLDLIRLEAQVYDIPQALALSEAETALSYSRVPIDGNAVLLPVRATLRVATVSGIETLNRAGLGPCEHYRAESAIRFETEEAPRREPERVAPEQAKLAIPSGALLEVALGASIDPAASKIGDMVKGVVVSAMKDGRKVPVPDGATVAYHVVRLEKKTAPFPIHEIGLEFGAIEIGDVSVPLTATMEEAGPAAGLLQQSKRLDPTFVKRGKSRMDILVKEVQRGQGILEWDARKGTVPRGLRMKWRLQAQTPP